MDQSTLKTPVKYSPIRKYGSIIFGIILMLGPSADLLSGSPTNIARAIFVLAIGIGLVISGIRMKKPKINS